MVQSILVATDLSARSDRAVERALMMARDRAAQLTVLHVVDDDLPAAVADRRAEEARRLIGDLLAARPDGPPRKADVRIEFGKAEREIIRLASETDAGLVILGTHRELGFTDLFRGTTVERVVRLGPCPVLVCREPARRPYRRLLAAVDLSVCSRRALDYARRLVPDGELHLVHAYELPFSRLVTRSGGDRISKRYHAQAEAMVAAEMDAFLAGVHDAPPATARVLREGSVFDVIEQEVARLKPDLLVVGTHGRTGVGRALLGSVAEALLREPPCDMLAVGAW